MVQFRQSIGEDGERVGILTGRPEGVSPQAAIGTFLENPQEWRLTGIDPNGECHFVYVGDPEA